MKEKKDNIEEVFASKLKGFEMDVPDSVWNQLSHKLPTREVVPQQKNRAKRISLWWSLVSVASVMLLLIVLRNQGSVDSPINVQKDEVKNIVQQTSKGKPETPGSYVKSENLALHSKNSPRKFLTSGKVSQGDFFKKKSGEILPGDTLVMSESLVENVATESANVTDPRKNESELKRKTDEFSNAAKDAAEKLFADADVKAPKQKGKSALGLTAAGGLGLASQKQTANQLLSLNDYQEKASSPLRSSSPMLMQEMASSSNSTYQLDHSWPVSFSVGITKPLASFLNLEVGISYTYLYSKQKGESNASMRQSQQFSYIGLPVGLNFRAATWNRFRLGILLGGNIQKDIAGRLKQEIKSSSSYEDYSTNSIHQKYFQPSVNANLHLSYSIGKGISLFGKAGGAYYFNMHDNYNTIYSDKNFLPDVGFGLSYNLEY
jgi:hypothetical protein